MSYTRGHCTACAWHNNKQCITIRFVIRLHNAAIIVDLFAFAITHGDSEEYR